MSFDDEKPPKKNPIFHGGGDRTAARKMLDAMGDEQGHKQRIITTADGVKIRARTKGGMPEVIVEQPPEKHDPIVRGFVFKQSWETNALVANLFQIKKSNLSVAQGANYSVMQFEDNSINVARLDYNRFTLNGKFKLVLPDECQPNGVPWVTATQNGLCFTVFSTLGKDVSVNPKGVILATAGSVNKLDPEYITTAVVFLGGKHYHTAVGSRKDDHPPYYNYIFSASECVSPENELAVSEEHESPLFDGEYSTPENVAHSLASDHWERPPGSGRRTHDFYDLTSWSDTYVEEVEEVYAGSMKVFVEIESFDSYFDERGGTVVVPSDSRDNDYIVGGFVTDNATSSCNTTLRINSTPFISANSSNRIETAPYPGDNNRSQGTNTFIIADYLFSDFEEDIYLFLEASGGNSYNTGLYPSKLGSARGNITINYVLSVRGVEYRFLVNSTQNQDLRDSEGYVMAGITVGTPYPVFLPEFVSQGDCPYIAYTTKAEEAVGVAPEIYVDWRLSPLYYTGSEKWPANFRRIFRDSLWSMYATPETTTDYAAWDEIFLTPVNIQFANGVLGPWAQNFPQYTEATRLEISRI